MFMVCVALCHAWQLSAMRKMFRKDHATENTILLPTKLSPKTQIKFGMDSEPVWVGKVVCFLMLFISSQEPCSVKHIEAG